MLKTKDLLSQTTHNSFWAAEVGLESPGRGRMSVSEPIVEFSKVVFSYDRVEVLHEISFQLNRGEVIGLLGPNGAGKTTTLKIIAGLLAPGGGAVSVAGLPLPERAIDVKGRIGYVPETALLFESLNGQEFLELSGRLHDVEENTLQVRIRSLLETFDLSSNRLRRLEGYSKGMRQKILIAAALLHNPELILLDEPLSGLDVNAAIMIKDLIAALAAEGKTIIYSSHVLDVVEKVCHRVLVIHHGNLIADASAENLKAATNQSTLEDAFRKLTDSADVDPVVARIISALKGSDE